MTMENGSPGFARGATLHSLEYLRAKIKALQPGLSPRLYALAEFLIHKPEKIAFLSVREVAAEVDISVSSVVRLCNLLGYEGYGALAREIQQTIQAELGAYGKFTVTRELEELRQMGPSPFEQIVTEEAANINRLLDDTDPGDFEACVRALDRADHVVVVGCMLSKMLAYYLHMGLSKLIDNTHLVTCHEVDVSAVARKLTKKSVVLTLSYPRYPKSHYEITGIMARQGARVITITDSPGSPVVPFSELVFYTANTLDSFTEAFAAPLVFIEALLTRLSLCRPDRTRENLKSYDRYDLVYKFNTTRSYDFEQPGPKD